MIFVSIRVLFGVERHGNHPNLSKVSTTLCNRSVSAENPDLLIVPVEMSGWMFQLSDDGDDDDDDS